MTNLRDVNQENTPLNPPSRGEVMCNINGKLFCGISFVLLGIYIAFYSISITLLEERYDHRPH